MAQILLVDDSISMREMVSFTLKEAGHDVIEAEDGIQALDVVQDNAFNLVITDVNMPNMDGIILTSKLRQLDSYRFTPIQQITGNLEQSIPRIWEHRSEARILLPGFTITS